MTEGIRIVARYEEFEEIFRAYEAGEITEGEASRRLDKFREKVAKQFEEKHGRAET